MINRESFITIMDAADEYFNGDIWKAFNLLGSGENVITDLMDNVLTAIDKDVDPKRLGMTDEYTSPCGSFIFEWVCGEGEFQEICKTAGDLYDYIARQYEQLKEEA
jgi:hypothetical protein